MSLPDTEAPPPPGWYPDPDGARPDQLRHFDGRVWTDRWVRKTTLDPADDTELTPAWKLRIAGLLIVAATAVAAVAAGVILDLHEDATTSVPVPSISQR